MFNFYFICLNNVGQIVPVKTIFDEPVSTYADISLSWLFYREPGCLIMTVESKKEIYSTENDQFSSLRI